MPRYVLSRWKSTNRLATIIAQNRRTGRDVAIHVQVPTHILFVDDSPEDVEIACWRLARAGVPVSCETVTTQSGLMAALGARVPDAIVSDSLMPGFDGWVAFRIARELAPGVPFIFHLGHHNKEMCTRALALGAYGCADKNDADALVELFRRLAHPAAAESCTS